MTVSLRLECPSDETFLRHLIIEGLAGELGASGWPAPVRSHLLDMQYTARRHSLSDQESRHRFRIARVIFLGQSSHKLQNL